jgi:hypothetical protein
MIDLESQIDQLVYSPRPWDVNFDLLVFDFLRRIRRLEGRHIEG